METRQRPMMMMMSSSTIRRGLMIVLTLMMVIMPLISSAKRIRNGAPKNMLVDTDVDTDDVFAILYLLKQPKSILNIKAITVSANNWIDAGHGVNLLYDLLYMMGRNDILVGVGGEGGITADGEILPNVGGYLPLIEQKLSTAGGCRYRQAVPHGHGGLLDSDTNYGVRKMFLPKGVRHYVPLEQPTVQEVMLKTLSSGSTTVLLIGSHTNFAILLMTHPELKRNIERIYIMGGAVKSKNPSGCCSPASRKMCQPNPCGDRGNLFDAVETDPWAEFNMFADPFAAYQVIHSGIPITLVPLDATNTIPFSEEFFSNLEENQTTYESQYVYQSLRMVRDTWFSDGFYQSYFMWDSFAAGIAVAGIKSNHNMETNEFAVISSKRITVITSNEPYGIQDGSNPFFSNRTVPMFHLRKQGVHSGHVMTGIQDGFCLVPNGKGKCMDGYTIETSNSNGVQIQVAQKAKLFQGIHSSIRTFSKSFLHMLNARENSGLFDLQNEYPYYREVLYKPPFRKQYLGKPVVYDMDMSPGDFITLFYLLKVPQEVIDLKAITVTASGWANAATIDIVYDILHMMGRDDIPVGLGEYFAIGQAYPPFNTTGSCKYRQSIPNGAGGYIDSDTLFGLAVDLPISPRRYTAHNSIKFGAQKNSQFPKLRQLRAQEVLHTVITTLQKDSKLTFLTGGPLTNIATMLSLNPSFKSAIEEIYITGGSIHQNGNVHTIEENHKAEFNMFLDPIAAKKVLGLGVKTKLIPLDVLQKTSLSRVLEKMADRQKTPEAAFVKLVLNKIHWLKSQSRSYSHTEKLAREVLGAVVMANEQKLGCVFKEMPITVMATGNISTDGWTKVDYLNGNPTWYLEDLNVESYEEELANCLNHPLQSAKIANFTAQKKLWHTPNITYEG